MRQSLDKTVSAKKSNQPQRLNTAYKLNKLKSSDILKVSFGWLETIADLALVTLITTIALQGTAYSARTPASKIISEGISLFKQLRSRRLQKSLRRGLHQIAKNGLSDEWQVTDEGYLRLKELVPIYHPQRPWDGSIYLVVFDIPENLKKYRRSLRERLKLANFKMLQLSVWIGFSQPQGFIEETLGWKEIEEFVLVFHIQKLTQTIKQKLIPKITKVYGLDKLNVRYQEFLDEAKTDLTVPMRLALKYLGILKDDPQLPFRLLPSDWVGDQAFRIYQTQIIPKLPHEQQPFIRALEMA